jgi:hypothetical protein
LVLDVNLVVVLVLDFVVARVFDYLAIWHYCIDDPMGSGSLWL